MCVVIKICLSVVEQKIHLKACFHSACVFEKRFLCPGGEQIKSRVPSETDHSLIRESFTISVMVLDISFRETALFSSRIVRDTEMEVS